MTANNGMRLVHPGATSSHQRQRRACRSAILLGLLRDALFGSFTWKRRVRFAARAIPKEPVDTRSSFLRTTAPRKRGMCPEVRGKRTAPSTPSSGYQIRRQPPRVREPRSDLGSRRCVVVESGQRR